MFSRSLLALFCLLCVSTSHAAEAIILAPDTAPACSFVLIDGSGSKATDGLRWTVPDTSVSVFTGQRSQQIIIYVDAPKQVEIVLTATDKGGKKSCVTKIVELTGDPDDETAPTPDPRPDDPDSAPLADPFAVRDQIVSEAKKLPAESRAEDTEAVIDELRKLRKKFADDEIGPRDSLKIAGAIRSLPRGLPDATAKRIHPFGNWWAGLLYQLYEGRKLMTKEDWLLLIDITIQALRAVL